MTNNKRRTLSDEERLAKIDEKIGATEKIIVEQQKILSDLKEQRNDLDAKIMQKNLLPIFKVMKAKGLSYDDLIKLMDDKKDETIKEAISGDDEVITNDEGNEHHAIKGSLDDILGDI